MIEAGKARRCRGGAQRVVLEWTQVRLSKLEDRVHRSVGKRDGGRRVGKDSERASRAKTYGRRLRNRRDCRRTLTWGTLEPVAERLKANIERITVQVDGHSAKLGIL